MLSMFNYLKGYNMEIFDNGDYKYISQFVEGKIPILRKDTKFNEKYLKLTDMMEELEKSLSPEQVEKFHEIVELFYKTEEFYFAFSYSLGVKYGQDLEKL